MLKSLLGIGVSVVAIVPVVMVSLLRMVDHGAEGLGAPASTPEGSQWKVRTVARMFSCRIVRSFSGGSRSSSSVGE